MKKIIALLMASVFLFALTACGQAPESNGTANTTTTATTTSITAETTMTTATDTTATVADTTTATSTTTEKPTTPHKTDAPHIHKYTSKVTKTATCTIEGVKTFTCACGDTYTEKLSIIGHKWSDWKQTAEPTLIADGKETRACSTCSKIESRNVAMPLERRIYSYVKFIPQVGSFESADEINAMNIFLIYWMYGSHTEDENSNVYAIKELDAFSTAIFGHKWDYSVIDGKTFFFNTMTCSYDAEKQTITITSLPGIGGMGGGFSNALYRGYEQIDDTHFVVTYDLEFEGIPLSSGNTFVVELINGKYIITANR